MWDMLFELFTKIIFKEGCYKSSFTPSSVDIENWSRYFTNVYRMWNKSN